MLLKEADSIELKVNSIKTKALQSSKPTFTKGSKLKVLHNVRHQKEKIHSAYKTIVNSKESIIWL